MERRSKGYDDTRLCKGSESKNRHKGMRNRDKERRANNLYPYCKAFAKTMHGSRQWRGSTAQSQIRVASLIKDCQSEDRDFLLLPLPQPYRC
ncbi:hypothetical protein J6590_034729 [Homalodisca vitripennis]|nr:hypothetical protein J6590_034729 [Homalodisca vitripennis]